MLQLFEEILFLGVNLAWQPVAQALDVGLILYLIGKYIMSRGISTTATLKTPPPSDPKPVQQILHKIASTSAEFEHRKELLASQERRITEHLRKAELALDHAPAAKSAEIEHYLLSLLQDRQQINQRIAALQQEALIQEQLALMQRAIAVTLADVEAREENIPAEKLHEWQTSYDALIKSLSGKRS